MPHTPPRDPETGKFVSGGGSGGTPSRSGTIPLTRGTSVRILGDRGTDLIKLDGAVGAGTLESIESFAAEDLWSFIEDEFGERSLLAVVTSVGIKVEASNTIDWGSVRVWKNGPSTAAAGEPGREDNDWKIFPETYEAYFGAQYLSGTVVDTGGRGGAGFYDPYFIMPVWPDWYWEYFGADDEVTVVVKHDDADADFRTSASVLLRYVVCETVEG